MWYLSPAAITSDPNSLMHLNALTCRSYQATATFQSHEEDERRADSLLPWYISQVVYGHKLSPHASKKWQVGSPPAKRSTNGPNATVIGPLLMPTPSLDQNTTDVMLSHVH